MLLRCGIVGLPNVGKSTLFNALSNNHAETANFPFCTIEPNVGVVSMPDPRLDILKNLLNSQKVIPATFEFVDIAGLVKGASKGEGLGNQFLAAIREVNAIIHVVRCFDEENIIHVDGNVNPVADKEIIDTELQLKDLESIEKRIQKLERLSKGGDSSLKKQIESLEVYRKILGEGKNIREVEVPDIDQEAIKDISLITAKPVIYVANVGEDSIVKGNIYVDQLRAHIKKEPTELILVCASIESQIASLDSNEDKKSFLEEYSLKESGLSTLIRSAYHLLGLITYFTAGEKEVRAWTIAKHCKAHQAAGAIHSDFEKGFIKAEVIKIRDYQKYKTELGCREAGKFSVEGKGYTVQDGDVMHFRFNV